MNFTTRHAARRDDKDWENKEKSNIFPRGGHKRLTYRRNRLRLDFD
jgi:hypothetical protein